MIWKLFRKISQNFQSFKSCITTRRVSACHLPKHFLLPNPSYYSSCSFFTVTGSNKLFLIYYLLFHCVIDKLKEIAVSKPLGTQNNITRKISLKYFYQLYGWGSLRSHSNKLGSERKFRRKQSQKKTLNYCKILFVNSQSFPKTTL